MQSIRQFVVKNLKKHRELLPLECQRKYFRCVTVRPKTKPAKGRVLVSYALAPAGLPDSHPILKYHGCYWMSNKIVSLFNKMGYVVDCIQYTNSNFVPIQKYDVIFSFSHTNLLRLVASAPGSVSAIKIWHSATSSIVYNNSSEIKRINDLEHRRPGALYFPKRQEPHERMETRAMQLADYIIYIGNKHVLATFPKEFHYKFSKITVAASPVCIKRMENFVSQEREFMWLLSFWEIKSPWSSVL